MDFEYQENKIYSIEEMEDTINALSDVANKGKKVALILDSSAAVLAQIIASTSKSEKSALDVMDYFVRNMFAELAYRLSEKNKSS